MPTRSASAPVLTTSSSSRLRFRPTSGGARVGAWVADHRRLVTAASVALLMLIAFPFAVGGIAAHLVASRATQKLGRPVTVARGWAGFAGIRLEDLEVAGAPGAAALVTVSRISAPWGVAFGMRQPVTVSGLRIRAVRGGAGDNVTDLLERLSGRSKAKPSEVATPPVATPPPPSAPVASEAPKPSSRIPDIVIEGAALEARDAGTHLVLEITGFDGEIRPDQRLAFRLRGVRGAMVLGGEGEGPSFRADELDLQTPLTGIHPSGVPSVRVAGGQASPLPSLSLTGIAGVIAPPPAAGEQTGTAHAGAAEELVIDLRGSYGGARETLWTAKGHAQPRQGNGKLSLRAEQFSLGRIADVLPASVIKPENTTLDAALDLDWAGAAVKFNGDLAVVGLSMQSEAISVDPVENVSLRLGMHGTVYPLARRLELDLAEARVRDLVGRVKGHVALPAGTFKFKNGRQLDVVPDIDLAFSVPRMPCAKLLTSIPSALVPRLQGFALKGTFAADFGLKVDFAHLDALDLWGKVGIDGCQVLEAPPDVTALGGPQSLVINVEVPKPPILTTGSAAAQAAAAAAAAAAPPDVLSVVVGPENPDFVPYDQISPYLVGSIMTTEDNGFFKHRGWVSSEFKSALRRNLERGGFRLGASSITMQMVKNVLLTKDKTLSRKLQELFLVWYLEQVLPKERILELYFNAIEFGPRIYGIGPAARHYFGKKASDLTPLEGAFFSSILPSPKRRYIQYCHGSLSAQWEKYIHRILAKAHERGRLTDEEYAPWVSQPLVFDRKEATFTEKQCLEWVKSMAPKPEPETPPELDEGDADVDKGFASKKLRRLFSHATAGRVAAPASKSAAVRGH